MPEPGHVLSLEATHLACFQPSRGRQCSIGLTGCYGTTLGQSTGDEEPPDRRVGRHRPQVRAGLCQGNQIVVMQLDAPALMGAILRQQCLAQRRGHRCLRAGVTPPLAAQHADRVVSLVAGAVEPTLERGDTEADRRIGARVTPFACRQLLQGGAQRAVRRRRGQQMADHRETQPRPTLMHPQSVLLRHARPSEQ